MLLERGIGFTNLVARPTRRADELRPDEIRAGADALEAKLVTLRPRIVAYTGSGVYRLFRRIKSTTWGIQPEPAVPGVIDVVLPSPSGLNRMRFEQLVEHYRVLVPLLSGTQPGEDG
jgi:TDG/mug DNA glycosylase family protein